ncbi:hypothetical protein [Almyronema epifaneia]|uniref:Uncharacterized protein n=1 Tax=Almyronema epifaneia S1 TaxID=2991925 RepID=A0ABW6IHT7_9CYAN
MQSLQQPTERFTPPGPPSLDFQPVPPLLDPALLRSARHIYRTYYEVHPDEVQRPLGVAISRNSRRGKLIFNGKPILLPHECFIPLNQIEPSLN